MSLPAKIVTLKILDETHVLIIGLHPTQEEFLHKKYSLFAKDYFFKPQYTMGEWNGKKDFYTKNSLTYVNLLPEIIPIIKSWGYKMKLLDNRQPISFDFKPIDKNYFADRGWVLGDHQVEAVNAVLENRGGIVIGGTGAGKTLITAVLCDIFNKHNLKVITVVPNSDLIDQTKEEISACKVDIGEYSGTLKDVNHPNVVSTWQAIQHNPKILSMFNVVIVDECHGAKGNVLQKLICEDAKHSLIRIGLTGTLPDHDCDRMSVRVALGNVVFTIPSHELIDKGWLASLSIKMMILKESLVKQWETFKANSQSNISYDTFFKEYFPDVPSEQTYLHGLKTRNKFLASLIEEVSNEHKGNTFILVKSVPFGKRLAKLIPNSVFVYGKDKKEIRRQIYDKFKDENNVVVISTFHLASTGLNIKRIFNLVLIDAPKSFIQIIQSIGRGLRKAHDKEAVNVYDVCSNLYYSAKHYRARMKHYTSAKYKYKKIEIDYEKLFEEDLFSID